MRYEHYLPCASATADVISFILSKIKNHMKEKVSVVGILYSIY